MVRLVPMTEQEFEAFMVLSMKDQAEGQVQAGEWKAEEAQGNIEKLREQFLPEGLATANHFFFTIQETSTEAKVGGLWYMLVEEDGKRQVFVLDIQIYEAYRRQGYGSQTFLAMEDEAKELGISTISLHVFKHNHSARAMYEKLGYRGISGSETYMSKGLEL